MPQEVICLLIDDDEDDQEIFTMALTEVNKTAKCVIASGGEQGLEKLDSLKPEIPDYIFVDLNMRRMNGKDFLKTIKEKEPFKHIPVIIYSTSSLTHDIEETRGLGASYYLVKPPSIPKLAELLYLVFNTTPPDFVLA